MRKTFEYIKFLVLDSSLRGVARFTDLAQSFKRVADS
jgi:hypothetical protein